MISWPFQRQYMVCKTGIKGKFDNLDPKILYRRQKGKIK